MLISYRRGQSGVVLRVKILDSSLATGAGLTGLTSASSGLRIGTIADNEATTTAYTVAGSTIETITTLGTFAAPTATKCRFKEVDATSHKGVYEIQIADARYAVASAKSLMVSISGATNAAETDVVIPLQDLDPYDAVRAGLTALPNAAANANGGLPILSSSGTTLAYTVSTLTTYTGNTVQTGDNYARIGAAGAGLTALGDTRIANLDATVSSRLAPTVAARTLDVSAGGEAGIDWANIGSPTTTVAFTGTTIGTITTYTGNTVQTGDSFARIGSAGAGLTALGDTRMANLDATVSSRLATSGYTAPLTAASMRTAIGMASANLDTQLASLDIDILSRLASSSYVAQTGDSYARIGAAGAGLTAIGDTRMANLDATVSSRLATSGYTAPPTAAANATAVLTTQMTESYNVDGTAPTLAQAQFVQMQRLTEFSISGTTITVKKLDGTTPAYTLTMDAAASSATSSTRAT